MIRNEIKRAFSMLVNSERAFKDIFKRSFESVLKDYLKLLIFVGVAAGIFGLLQNLLKALYFDLFLTVDIQYLRMLNYSLGRSVSLLFLYFFSGTFLVFLLTVLIRPFFRKIKYVHLIQLILCSLSPVLLFGWIVFLLPGLFMWSLVLFVQGIRSGMVPKIKKDSILQRD